MAQTDIGKIGFTVHGDWTPTAYEKLSLVRHNGATWVSKVGASASDVPSPSSAVWKIVAADSSTSGENVSFLPSGNISATNVSSAIRELDAEKSPTNHTHTKTQIETALGLSPVGEDSLLTTSGRTSRFLSQVDLNSLTDGGIYFVEDPQGNKPFDDPSYGAQIFVQTLNRDWIWQTYYGAGIGLRIFQRFGQYISSTNNYGYTPWLEVATSARLKTIGGQSLIGTGDIPMKTIGGQSLIGTGDIPISGGLGVGQTWQNVTGSRSLDVAYVNTTGRPIAIAVRTNREAGAVVLYTDGIQAIASSEPVTSRGIFGIVASGSAYLVSALFSPNPPVGVETWTELR